MDTQTKVIFEVKTLNGTFDKTIIKEINTTNYPNGVLTDNFFEFSEHSFVKVWFQTDCKEASLKLETYVSDDLVELKPGESLIVSPGYDGDDMLVPGYYTISVQIGREGYEGLFKVEPTSISWNGLLELRSFLENILQGFSYNQFLQRVGYTGKDIAHKALLLEIYNYLKSNENDLFNSISHIIKNPITNLYKEYKVTESKGKPDMKSEKWLSKKGASVNKNIHVPDKVYLKHSELSLDNIENKWVNKVIQYTAVIISDLELSYSLIAQSLVLQKQKKENEMGDEVAYYELIKNNVIVTDRDKQERFSKIKILNEEIEKLKGNSEFIDELLTDTKKFKALLAHSKYETWIKDIKNYDRVLKPTIGMLRNSRYNFLYGFYQQLISMEKEKKSTNNTILSHKRTSKLFEYYIVMLTIKILKEKGFKWTSGWLAENSGELISDLPSETVMTYESSGRYCQLIYDKEISRMVKNKAQGQFIAVNQKSRTPDITLALFDSSTSEVLGAVIIEVKCRKSRYLYSEVGDTKVMEQIKDYYNLGYYDPNIRIKKKIVNVVNCVIVAYPKQEEKVSYNKPDYNFEFIQIEPAEIEEKAVGYEELKRGIEMYLLEESES